MTAGVELESIQKDLNRLTDRLPKTVTIESPKTSLARDHVDGLAELIDTLSRHRVALHIIINPHPDALQVDTRSQQSNNAQPILDRIRVHVNGVDGHAMEVEDTQDKGRISATFHGEVN